MKRVLKLKWILAGFIIFAMVACASKNGKISRASLAYRMEPTTTWKNYSESKKADLVFTALITKLTRGYELLLKNELIEAYYEFDSILSDPKFMKYDEYKFSKFYIAQTLHMLGVNYGSLLYFIDILKKEDDKPYLTESLRRAIAISQDLKDDSLILYLATILTTQRIDPSMREEFRFFIAKNFYLNNTYKNSVILFKAITPKNRLYHLAQYYLGVTAVQRGKYKTAMKHFTTIASDKNPSRYYEWQNLRDLSNMNIGRIFYEAGANQKAQEYYGRVPKDSELYPRALYESSWALYNWGKFNAALSTLHSLQSPYYEITYFPRSILLRGAIFLELCMHKDAIIALKSLEDYYAELKTLMDSFYSNAKSKNDYYNLLTGPENLPGDHALNPYRKLFMLASENRDFLQMHKFVKELNDELKVLAQFKDNKRAVYLSNHIKKKRSVVMKKAINLAIEKIQLTRKAISDYLKSADVVKLEITTAERKLLEDKVKGYTIEGPSEEFHVPPPPQSSIFIQDSYYFYKFNGEYWKDEIGHYLYNIKSQCIKKGN